MFNVEGFRFDKTEMKISIWNGWGRWGCEGTPLGLEYTIPRRAATPPPPKKKPGTPKCGLGQIRKLTQFYLSLLGVSRVTRTRRRTGGKSGNV
jgi:hypothetical protein